MSGQGQSEKELGQSGALTLMFTDLVNSTTLLQSLGEDAAQRVFQAHHKLISEAVVGNGGEELEWLGDGVLATFSSSADAVRCGINIEQTARRPVGGTRLDIRIGLHFGEVLKREGGYFGMPLVVARRLCDRAESGQILCSKIVADLLASRQSFNFRDLGLVPLKGLRIPTQIFEVLYEINDPLAVLKRTPFVGRTRELKRLAVHLDELLNGHGSVVMLCGEPGIGKSRTLDEFSDLARERGAMVIGGACYEGEWQAPYGPFAEAVVDAARKLEPSDRETLFVKRAPILARFAPGLAEVLGDIEEPPALGKEEERLRLFDAVTQFMIGVARTTRLVVVLDDLHWADRGTAAMLGHVAHFINGNGILLLGAYRDAEVDPHHPLAAVNAAISRQRNFDLLNLGGLGEDDLSVLLDTLWEEPVPLPIVKAVGGATEGNPLFIRELLLNLLEESVARGNGRTWRISTLSAEDVGVPESVRQIVGRRLLRLSDKANRLLSIASAFHGEFSFDVALRVSELGENPGLEALDEALGAQVLRPGSDSEHFDFRHQVIRATTYTELNPVRRIRLHRRIAEAMEQEWSGRLADHASEIAYQFWRSAEAGGAERGVRYALMAADRAESAYAFGELAAFLRIALDLLPGNDSRRPRLLARLGAALIWTLDGEEGGRVTSEAAALIAQTEGPAAAGEFLEGIVRSMVRAGLMDSMWRLAREGLAYVGDQRDLVWASLDEMDTYRENAESPLCRDITLDSPRGRERRRLLRTLPPGEVTSKIFAGMAYLTRDEIMADQQSDALMQLLIAGDCQRGLGRWQEIAVEEERTGRIAMAMEAWALVARCQLTLGNFADAKASFDKSISFAHRFNRPSFQLVNVVSVRSDFTIFLHGNGPEIPEVPGSDDLMLRPPVELQWAHSGASAIRAHGLALNGKGDEAMELLADLRAALIYGAYWAHTYIVTACDAAAVLWMLGRTEHADLIEQSVREKVIVPDFRFPMRDGRLSLARLCALKGRYDEALTWFDDARRVFDKTGWRPLRAIADYDAAQMHLQRGAQGDEARADELLGLAHGAFTDLGMGEWAALASGEPNPPPRDFRIKEPALVRASTP